MNSQALWYFSRGTGLVALLGLTATTALGLLSASRVASPSWPRFVTQGLHRNLGLLVLVALAGHVVAVVVDSYVSIDWVDAVVPFGAAYHPMWVGLGALAADAMIALVLTSLLRHRLGFRSWRAVHWLGYAAWPVALVHGLGVGTDAATTWMRVLAGACAAAVAAALVVRLVTLRRAPRPAAAVHAARAASAARPVGGAV
jgi:predicted ferric reductase